MSMCEIGYRIVLCFWPTFMTEGGANDHEVLLKEPEWVIGRNFPFSVSLRIQYFSPFGQRLHVYK